MIAKLNLPLCAALASLLMCAPVAAQSQTDDDKLERLQRRTEMLERELKALRQEIKKTKKDAEKVEKVDQVDKSEPAQGAVQTTVESSHTLTSYETGVAPAKPMPSVAGVKVTLGGFIAAESVYRTHNQVADMGSTFNAIPYPFSPLYREHEFHASARGTRLSLLAEGNIDPRRV
jgi:hypothetical protein